MKILTLVLKNTRLVENVMSSPQKKISLKLQKVGITCILF